MFSTHYKAPHRPDGRVLRLLDLLARQAADLIERAQTEAALRESEQRFRVAQELSPDGFTIFRPVRDTGGRVVDFTWVYENAAIARLNGTDPETVVGKSLLELFPGHASSPFLEAYRHVAETGETRILEGFYHGDSIPTPTWLRFAVVSMEKDIAILAQDITERKQVEDETQRLYAAVRQQRDTLSALVGNMPDEVWFADAQKKFTLANPSALREFALDSDSDIDIERFAASLEVYRPDGSPRPVRGGSAVALPQGRGSKEPGRSNPNSEHAESCDTARSVLPRLGTPTAISSARYRLCVTLPRNGLRKD